MKKRISVLTGVLAGVLAGAVALTAGTAQAIVGGSRASTKDLPHLLMLLDARGQQYCAAALIAPDAAVTAAHCLLKKDVSTLTVVAGRDDKRSTAGSIAKIASAAVHPDFTGTTGGHDVAVLHLAAPLTGYRTVPLARRGSAPAPGAGATVAGWGDTDPGDQGTRYLMKATVPVVAPKTCATWYPSFREGLMTCAGYEQGGADTCKGDSGAPLVVQGALVGLASWGEGCGQARRPGVYTSLGHPAVHDFVTRQVPGSR
ncbi:S1 family peptidase [Kitasatospora sp. NPDC096147]|uniref:S1 family peptidase n=1 Tax=Kitasatospora sp. NPDC096147 TaxID=3364093 RepID=UPI003816EB66